MVTIMENGARRPTQNPETPSKPEIDISSTDAATSAEGTHGPAPLHVATYAQPATGLIMDPNVKQITRPR